MQMTDGRQTVPVRILRVDTTRTLKDISDEDARDEGFTTRQELLLDLRRYYPRASATDPITIIYFELARNQESLF